MTQICRYAPAKDREEIWVSAHGSLPEGMRVGWNCLVPYCGKLEHMVLAENKNYFRFHWQEIAAKVASLSVGAWVDFPDLILPTNRIGVALMNTNACRNVRFVMRQLPTGRGHRIIRTGSWGSYYRGITDEKSVAHYPLLFGKRIRPWRRQTIIWLGQWFGAQLNRPTIIKPLACKVRACPLPVLKGEGEYCHHHNHFFDYNESMTGTGMPRLYSGRAPYMPWELAAEFLQSTNNLEKSLKFTLSSAMVRRPDFDARHKNAGTDLASKPTALPNYSRGSGRGHMRLGHGGGNGTNKTRKGKRRTTWEGRGDEKEKRWTRETIATLEKQADEILKAEMAPAAQAMRERQECELATRVYPLCQGYEVLEPEISEEEERAATIAKLFDQYDIADFGAEA